MIHPDSTLHLFDTQIGSGVRATRPIPRGTLLWVRDPLDRIVRDEVKRRMPEDIQRLCARFGYQDHRGSWILCWDNAKHVNHSCAPTMRGLGPDAMIAVRDVLEGEELSCDYAECNLEEELGCLCKAQNCRQTITGDDLLHYWREWQDEIESALALASSLPQPLLEAATNRVELRRVISGMAPPPTLRDVHFDRNHPPNNPRRRRTRVRRSSCVLKRESRAYDPPRSSLQMDSTETRVLPNGQRGLFTIRRILAGEVVVVFGGQAMTLEEIRALPEVRRRFALQVEEDVFLYSPHDGPGDWVNHSCSPNAGLVGQIVLVALRDIPEGEEVCFDYAMSDMTDYDQFRCKCGAPNCRANVTSSDWMLPELRTRYRNFFAPHVQRAISTLNDQ